MQPVLVKNDNNIHFYEMSLNRYQIYVNYKLSIFIFVKKYTSGLPEVLDRGFSF